MPVLRINASFSGLALHHDGGAPGQPLSSLGASQGPAIIMVHGYKYAPCQPNHSPHLKIFSDTDSAWPAQLGFGRGTADEGLGIALGWYARGPFQSVYRRATQLGQTLSVLISMLKAGDPNRPVHVIAHSLGAQAALSALAHLPAGAVDRMVLLTGASFASYAAKMLATPAGRTTEVFNITSRENDVFDMAFEHLVTAPRRGDHAIGRGIDAENVRSLQLDCPQTLAVLSQRGFPIAKPERRICHWSAYKRPGVMALYQSLMRAPDRLPLTAFDGHLPETPAPRWSRLMDDTAHWRRPSLPISFVSVPLALQAGKRMMRRLPLSGKSHEHAH